STDDTDASTFDPAAATHPGSIIGTGTISFDSDGKVLGTPAIAVQMNRTATGANTPLNVNLDFSHMTALTSTQSQMLMSNQNGRAIGTLTNFSIGSNGLITGAFDNGLTSTLGQVAMATFDNPEGLIDDGASLYSTGANSGAAKITGPLTLDAGAIRSGALEASSVDISKE